MNTLRPGPRFNEASQAPKYVAFDVDNTLVGNESADIPSPRFIAAVTRAAGQGMAIGIASARPLAKVQHIIETANMEGPSILCNGAQVYDAQTGRFIVERTLPLAAANQAVAMAHAEGMECWVNDDGVDYFPVWQGDAVRYETQRDVWDLDSQRDIAQGYTIQKPFVVVFRHVTAGQVEKINTFVANQDDDDIAALIAHETVLADGNKVFDIFMVHRLANKLDALHEILKQYKWDISEVAVAGDGRNDSILVGAAGVGIAMGNSAQETLDVATHIAPNQWDDGAAIALESLIDKA